MTISYIGNGIDERQQIFMTGNSATFVDLGVLLKLRKPAKTAMRYKEQSLELTTAFNATLAAIWK